MDTEIPDGVAELARRARDVVVLSGAGISAESGVPTFREVQTGLWERFSAQDLATPEAYRREPALVFTWYRWREALIRAVPPNPGHLAIARWQHRLSGHGGRLRVVTQNIDDLHERAGAEVLAHLHGSITGYRCSACGRPASLEPPVHDGVEQPPAPEEPPRCQQCGSRIRPGVVWFGEMLPEESVDAAVTAIGEADLVLVVGTSGMVHPAASLPVIALERGIPVVEVNPEETELTHLADHVLRGPSGEVLPAMAEAACA